MPVTMTVPTTRIKSQVTARPIVAAPLTVHTPVVVIHRDLQQSSIAKTNVSHGSGWLLGSFSWHYRIKDHDFDRQDLTVLLNSQEASVEGHVDGKLVRVVADPPRGAILPTDESLYIRLQMVGHC